MGFIERLREKLAAEKALQEQKDRELAAIKQDKEAARLQKEAQEIEYHQKRGEQAELFRQESGISPLMADFGRFLSEEGLSGPPSTHSSKGYISKVSVRLINERTETKDPQGYPIGYPTSNYGHAGICDEISYTDPDSVFEVAEWDLRHTGYGKDKSGLKGWSEAEEKFLVVETNPNGDIVFHARNRKTVPVQKWRSDKEILGKYIENAFHHPGVNRIKYNHHEAWSESG